MMKDITMADYIRSAGYEIKSKEVTLKGVGNFVKVHLCNERN